MIRPLLLSLGVLLVPHAVVPGRGEPDGSGGSGYDSHLMLLGAPVLGLELCDVDGDGMKELLLSRYAGLEVWSLKGETLAADALQYELRKGDQRTLVWCVAPSPHSTHSIYVIREGGEVALWSPARVEGSRSSAVPDGVELRRLMQAIFPAWRLCDSFLLIHRVCLHFPGVRYAPPDTRSGQGQSLQDRLSVVGRRNGRLSRNRSRTNMVSAV